ncbi:MAG: ABC transporter ATP-binding protein [Candidatus Taylorbacteria bacterium]
MNTIIKTENISKTFKDRGRREVHVLSQISLDITRGEFFVLLGPSGSGKSTLLRIMSKLEAQTSGSVSYEGLTPRDINFVFQDSALLPWLTVAENIEIGLIGRGIAISKRDEMVRKELKEFNLEKFTRAFPRELSGGMKQRVGLARAFITEPKLIFLDEPFSELDFFTAKELRLELLQLWRARDTTVVMVSHNITEAIELADRIAVLTHHPGGIKKIVENVLARPRDARSKEFFEMEDVLYSIIKEK